MFTDREETPMHPPTSLRRALGAVAVIAATALSASPALADVAPPPTAQDVCLLTKADVQSSARYLALPAGKRAAADRYWTDLCAKADAIVASLTPAQKADLYAAFCTAADKAVPQGWLTADQATTLEAMAALI
jgi:hypothetical protein